MNPPTSRKEAQNFIGVVNYCRNMWELCLHILTRLTNMTSSKVKFKWTKIKQDTFDEVKRILAHDTLLAYPNFSEEFKIHTDDRDFHLGAVIIQKGKPIDLYIRKHIGSQKRYTVSEK